MRRSVLASVTLLTVLLLGLVISRSPSSDAANLQTAPTTGNVQIQAELPEGGLPVAPAFVLMRRINIDADGQMPLHSHPGLSLYRVESGTLAVTVSGKAMLLRAATENGTPTAASDAPLDEEFRMRRGDTLVAWAQTPKTYRNPGDRPTKVLAGFLLPAGHQHPPTISYLSGASSSDIKGVSPEFLGDAVAPNLPPGPSVVTIDRLSLEGGEPIPAFDGPVILSVTSGVFDFTTVSGEIQVSRAADQSVVANPAAETAFSLSKGDAVFFPGGIQETPRSEQDGELQLLRLTIAGGADTGTPVAAGEPGVIAMASPATPAATTEPTKESDAKTPEAPATTEAEPTATTEAEPTATTETGRFGEGDVAVVTEDGVNLRSGPSTEADIVIALDAGQQVTITGPSEEGGDFTWWPVTLVDDESVSGYMADDFLQAVEE
jgi:mannose-6-phosphate isomerase-like protein (cupin superfamily)